MKKWGWIRQAAFLGCGISACGSISNPDWFIMPLGGCCPIRSLSGVVICRSDRLQSRWMRTMDHRTSIAIVRAVMARCGFDHNCGGDPVLWNRPTGIHENSSQDRISFPGPDHSRGVQPVHSPAECMPGYRFRRMGCFIVSADSTCGRLDANRRLWLYLPLRIFCGRNSGMVTMCDRRDS